MSKGDQGNLRTDGNEVAGKEEAELIRSVSSDQRAQRGWHAGAIPMERSARFGESVRRLFQVIGRERSRLALVGVCAVGSVALNVVGPLLLGHATDLIVSGVGSRRGRRLRRPPPHAARLPSSSTWRPPGCRSPAPGWSPVWSSARCSGCASRPRQSSTPCRSPTSIASARGDLLSRVTNDLDNLSQSLQQTLSQMLTSVLLLVGVTIMMFTISWLLTLIALITVPLSIYGMRKVAARARPQYLAQWSSTGALNAQIEEAFTGHAIVKAFGRQADVEARFEQTNDRLYEASFGAQFMSSLMQPLTMFLGNVQYVLVAVVGGLQGVERRDHGR